MTVLSFLSVVVVSIAAVVISDRLLRAARALRDSQRTSVVVETSAAWVDPFGNTLVAEGTSRVAWIATLGLPDLGLEEESSGSASVELDGFLRRWSESWELEDLAEATQPELEASASAGRTAAASPKARR